VYIAFKTPNAYLLSSETPSFCTSRGIWNI